MVAVEFGKNQLMESNCTSHQNSHCLIYHPRVTHMINSSTLLAISFKTHTIAKHISSIKATMILKPDQYNNNILHIMMTNIYSLCSSKCSKCKIRWASYLVWLDKIFRGNHKLKTNNIKGNIVVRLAHQLQIWMKKV